jgi:hypothetical protein
MTVEKNNRADQVVVNVMMKFYEKILSDLTIEEKKAINSTAKQAALKHELGGSIKKAIFNFVCPDTGTLVAVGGFNAHGQVNEKTNDIEAVLTVECDVCKHEHPVLVISFGEMFAVPEIE